MHIDTINLNIKNETDFLEIVLLGIANDFGGTPRLNECFDPKSRENVRNNTFPIQMDVIEEMNNLYKIFQKYNVEVLRPKNIRGLNQIFSRDIAIVINDKIIIPNIIVDRSEEKKGIESILDRIPSNKIVRMPSESRLEGGDVIIWNEYIFVGYSEEKDFNKYKVSRTNRSAIEFLQNYFLEKKIKGFQLCKSDIDPKENALHLDCCFQPIGKNCAILYEKGFKKQEDVDFIVNIFGKKSIISVSQQEMYNMNCNVFSISPEVIVSDKSFIRLNQELRNRDFIVEEVSFQEIAKMGGLFRCSTMPIKRK